VRCLISIRLHEIIGLQEDVGKGETLTLNEERNIGHPNPGCNRYDNLFSVPKGDTRGLRHLPVRKVVKHEWHTREAQSIVKRQQRPSRRKSIQNRNKRLNVFSRWRLKHLDRNINAHELEYNPDLAIIGSASECEETQNTELT
jgi:hypothetical protein